jgi:carbamoyltransferase
MTRTPKILGKRLGLPQRVPLICMPHHDNHALFSFAASPFADSDEPVAIAVLDGTGDRGSISLYVTENGAMRRLYCNDSMFDSLGAFYSVISSTQGGWTWLSSEGRYMGAAAWGDMNRASNPYYARLKEAVIHADGTGRIQIVRAEDDPLTYAYLKALGRHIGVEMSVNTSFNVAGPIAQTPSQAIDTLRRSIGLDVVLLVASDGAAYAAWHGGNRDSGRFTGWFSEWKSRERT